MSRGSEVGSQQSAGSRGKLRTGRSEILPMGWVTTSVSDICEQIRGVSYNKNDVRFVKTLDYLPLLRANNINEAIVFSDLQYVPKSIVNKKQLLKMGDVLIAMSSGSKKVVGKTASLGQDWLGTFGAFCGVLRPLQSINNGFCPFFFKTQYYRNTISKLATGTNINNIKTTHFDEIILPLPPLNEQKRIVAKLNKIMPRIDAVKERLDKVPAIVKRFRQSVLTAAVTGKLTEMWRAEHPDVESAEVLLKNINKTKNESHRQKKITKPKPVPAIGDDDIKFEVPDSWLWCRLAQISFKMSTGPFGTMLHKSDYISKGIPVINPTNIKNSTIIPSEKMMISQDTLERLNRYKLDVNDIIIARRGDLSKCGIVTDMEKGWLCGTGSFFLKVGIEPIFFRLFYISDYCQTELNEDSIGSTMQNLNQKVLSNTPFPLPPLEEQTEIVRQVDKLFALADRLESHYKKAKAKVDKLSQSVLAKAFRGELVITEAELAEKEGRDFENAEKLLERILEEKAKLVGSRQRIVGGVRSARGSKGKQKETGGKKK